MPNPNYNCPFSEACSTLILGKSAFHHVADHGARIPTLLIVGAFVSNRQDDPTDIGAASRRIRDDESPPSCGGRWLALKPRYSRGSKSNSLTASQARGSRTSRIMSHTRTGPCLGYSTCFQPFPVVDPSLSRLRWRPLQSLIGRRRWLFAMGCGLASFVI